MAEFILHHYPLSPYAEKIRTGFGIKQLAWRSVAQNLPPALVADRTTPSCLLTASSNDAAIVAAMQGFGESARLRRSAGGKIAGRQSA